MSELFPLPAAPASVAQERTYAAAPPAASRGPVYPTASKERRFCTYVIDRVLAFAVTIVAVILLSFGTALGDVELQGFASFVVVALMVFVAYGSYYFVPEWRTGRTLGKYLTRTQVLTTRAEPISAWQAFRRSICRAVPFYELTILFNSNNRALHDLASDTVVVEHKSVPQQFRPRHERLGQALAIGLILLLPVPLVGALAYQELTGGDRYELPAAMPADLQLTKFESIRDEDDDRSYERLTYAGNGRELQFTRLFAGTDYDANNRCVYTRPTKDVLFTEEQIDPGITCTRFAQGDWLTAYVVTGQPSDPEITPDYIIVDVPFRYAVKVTSGTLTNEEVDAMVKNHVTVTERDLKKTAARNAETLRPNPAN